MVEPFARTITSLHNPAVKLVRSLDRRKVRRAEGLFVAEGLKVIATGRDRGWAPRFLLMRDLMREDAGAGDESGNDKRMSAALIAWAARCGASCLTLGEAAFAKVAARDNPQDLIAVFAQRWETLSPAAPGEKGVWVALEEVRDPGNLGTIVRTADAAGAKGVILVGTCCDPYSREAVRATMGSIFTVPLARMERDAFLAWRAAWPGAVVGAAPAADEDFRGRYREPVLLIMGGEGPGLSVALAQTCTRRVRIPMTGSVDSLNLAIATALMLYEIRRDNLTS